MVRSQNKINVRGVSFKKRILLAGAVLFFGGAFGPSVFAQDVSGTLGKALVSKAEDQQAQDQDLMNIPSAPAPIVAPAAPTAPVLSPSDQVAPEDRAPLLPMEILDGIKLPPLSNQSVLDKVESDVEAELKRLEEAQGKLPSILFTEDEGDRLNQAIAIYDSGNFAKPVTPTSETIGVDEDPLLNVEIVDRNLILGGISFGDGVNWVIWLNKQRLTPTRLPVEVKYVKVYKDHVDLKWFDKLTSQLISVRLRPNQRFNLDARSFLPG